MELYSPKITPLDRLPAPKPGDITHYHRLCDHVFSGDARRSRKFECEVAYRVQHPDEKLPGLTLVDMNGHSRICPCFKLLADLIGMVGVKVAVLIPSDDEREQGQ